LNYLCPMSGIRINKFIRETGFFSRREADKAIEDGRVTINKKTAKTGAMVNELDLVHLDGELIRPVVKSNKKKTQHPSVNPKSKTLRKQQSESNKTKFKHK
jgi:16S rRNA U516 pseudouridylate synthase RsuA-like enzyme